MRGSTSRILSASVWLACAAHAATPCPTRRYTLCILGADDAGAGAAWAAASLGISAVVTSWAARDIGGDLASGVRTDLFTSARNAGGLSLAYDRFARRSSDTPCGFANTARIAPPGPSYAWLRGVVGDGAVGVDFLSGYLPLPGRGILDGAGRVAGVLLGAEDGGTCALQCRYAIEGTSEGYALRAFNQTVRFGREGVRTGTNCSDPTNCGESLAGRRVFGPCHPPRAACNATATAMGVAPRWDNVSDTGEEEEDVSSAASAILALRRYARTSSAVPPDAPWILRTPPAGFENGSFAFILAAGAGIEGWMSADVVRAEFEHAAGLPRWYEQPDPATGAPAHYLRLPGSPWPLKRAVDAKSFWYATAALYYYQHFVPNGATFGLDNSSYALAGACVNASAFGAHAYGGADYEQLSCRLYRRVTARLASPRAAVGGEAMLPRPLFAAPSVTTSRTYWEPSSLGAPLYPVDYRGVLLDTVPLPAWAGPEGLVSLVYGGIGGTDVHGLARRVLEPDPAAGAPRVLNLLSPGAPRATFQAQAALRIHATASNLGVGAVALVAAAERSAAASTDAVPTALAQWLMARVGAVLAFADAGLAGSEAFALAQLPGARGVPPLQLGGYAAAAWAPPLPTRANASLWLAMYACGLLDGAIPRWPPPPAIPPPPPLPAGVALPWAPGDGAPLSRADLAAALDAILPGSAAAVLAAPLAAPTARVHLRDLRAVLTRHILFHAGVASALSGLPPYAFPTYALVDSWEGATGSPADAPDLPAAAAGSCNTSAGLMIAAGVLVRDAAAPAGARLTRLCAAPALAPVPGAGRWPAFSAAVDVALEQAPVGTGNASIAFPGLYFLYQSADAHGWFGLIDDAGASGADGAAGAGFDANQTLAWGLRLPTAGSIAVLRADVPWPDGRSAVFSLRVDCDGETLVASVNSVPTLRGAAGAPGPDAPVPAFGIRAGEAPGEGVGRAVWGNLVVTVS